MRKNKVRQLFFTSSSTIYGEANTVPTPENYSKLEPISLYGASKLACEVLICSYSHSFNMNSVIFRLANVIGPNCHGVISDFISKLKRNPNILEILGDGKQKKSYIYIDDCIEGLLVIIKKINSKFEIFNIGSEDFIDVKTIAARISQEMSINPILVFSGGDRGWEGDIPIMKLDIRKIKGLGWKPKYNSNRAIIKTVKSFLNESNHKVSNEFRGTSSY
jgi:UDP-glucose 4-epimerase